MTARNWLGVAAAFSLLASCSDPAPAPLPDAGAAVPTCGEHSYLISDGRGGKRCECKFGYEGPDCRQCAEGFSDVDTPGRCFFVTPPPDCSTQRVGYCGFGSCDTSLSPPACRCLPGSAGPQCGECAPGYYPLENETCSNCGASIAFCVHGTCDGTTDPTLPTCRCPAGYEGPRCDQCAAGYRPEPLDGTCRDCASGHFTCDGHGTCQQLAGLPTCSCEAGFVAVDGIHCAPIAGASCASPLPFDLRTGHVRSTTLGGAVGPLSSCRSLRDQATAVRILKLTLPSERRVRLRALSLNGIQELTVSVRGICSSASSEIGCLAWASLHEPLELTLPAGDSFLVVESDSGRASDFEVAVEVICPAAQFFAWDRAECVADPCAASPCGEAHRHDCRVAPDGTFSCGCDAGYQSTSTTGACSPVPNATGSRCEEALPLSNPFSSWLTLPPQSTFDSAASSCGTPSGFNRYFSFYLPQRSRVRVHAKASSREFSVSLRRNCSDPTGELLCQNGDPSSAPALTGGILEAGSYVAMVDGLSESGQASFKADIYPDPCLSAACGPQQHGEPSADWSSCRCACPEGQLALGDSCIADPCQPNPCSGATSRCVADGPAASHCACPLGFSPDAADPTRCAAPPALADWTVIVYEDHHNNLGNELRDGPGLLSPAVSTQPGLNVVWLWGALENSSKLIHVGGGASSEVLADWGQPDLGDWRTLRDFGLYAVRAYPARRYALVIHDHGGGLGFAWDDGAGGSFISIPRGDYARALQAIIRETGQLLEVVDFETCLLATWEVAEATQPYARSLIASPEIAFGNGAGILAGLIAQRPAASMSELGHTFVDGYASSTMDVRSWIDLSAVSEVTAALSAMADALRARLDLCPAYDALASGCRIYFGGEADLGGFAQRVAQSAQMPADGRNAADLLFARLTSMVYVQPAASAGLSIYLPQLSLAAGTPGAARALDSTYLEPGAVWTADSTWDEFLTECRQR